MLTGWPPQALLVTVIITAGTVPGAASASVRRSASRSMLPLNGCRADVSRDSAHGRSSACAPRLSTWARVVSKWALLGMTSPPLAMQANRMCSAARPWWVGITCRKPVMSRTAASKR